jgi:hypothetical protein
MEVVGKQGRLIALNVVVAGLERVRLPHANVVYVFSGCASTSLPVFFLRYPFIAVLIFFF